MQDLISAAIVNLSEEAARRDPVPPFRAPQPRKNTRDRMSSVSWRPMTSSHRVAPGDLPRPLARAATFLPSRGTALPW